MRRIRLLLAGVLGLVLRSVPTTARAQTGPCVGTVQVLGTSNHSTVSSRRLTVVRFDLTSTTEICLADGSKVTGTVVGHFTLLQRPDGTGTVYERDTVSIAGGAIEFLVTAQFTPTSFNGSVIARNGTGVLSGVTGRGTFFPTGPTTFGTVIFFRYP